jgi:hypothetical protein
LERRQDPDLNRKRLSRDCPKTALADLKARYQEGCPHEIGTFLGIPLPDILSFIDNGGKKAIADGYWKVYHDPGRKLELFARYQEAKRCFFRFMMTGKGPGEYLNDRALALADLTAGD